MAHRYPYIRSLVNTLNSVTRPGSFANGGMFQLPLPALKINGVDGVVRFPASDAQAKAIIAVCLQAPYGRGEETIVDTSVRNTWQLDPTHFTIMNPEWNSAVKSLAAVVGRELGCNPSLNVCCELHKFLLYEQGSFFKPHRDTEKADGMFGTMVVQLPSDYDGGVLRVCHRGEEMTFDFSGLKGMTGFHYAAFYADCQHELCEVTRGYRMCLVYNLVYSGSGAHPVPIDIHQIVDKVVAGIQDWEQDDNGLPVLAYMLNHKYCEASLSFKLLKNADRAIAEILLEANKQKDFYLYLGTVTLHQICWGDGESDDMDIYNNFEANKLVSPSGATLDSIRLDKNAIVPNDVFDEAKPDDEKLQATGNEGTTLNKTYHQAALHMWPKKHRVIVMGVVALISELESKLATPGCEPNAQQQQECEVMAKEIIVAISKDPFKCLPTNAAVRLLACLRQLKAASLTSELLQAIAVDRVNIITVDRDSYLSCQSFSEAVIKSCIAFGWEQLEPALVVFFSSFASDDVEESCTFLSTFADVSVSSQQIKVCQKLVDIICHVLTSEEDISAPSVRAYYSTRSQPRPKEFVCKLFKFFCVLQCEEQLKIVVQSFFKQPNRYPLSTTLVPAAIELHQCMYKGSHAPLYFLLSHCVSTLQHKGVIGTPNWSNNSDLNCRCELCTVLTAFLNDPAKMQEYQSQLALLHHVHPLLEQLEKPSKLRRLKADHQ